MESFYFVSVCFKRTKLLEQARGKQANGLNNNLPRLSLFFTINLKFLDKNFDLRFCLIFCCFGLGFGLVYWVELGWWSRERSFRTIRTNRILKSVLVFSFQLFYLKSMLR